MPSILTIFINSNSSRHGNVIILIQYSFPIMSTDITRPNLKMVEGLLLVQAKLNNHNFVDIKKQNISKEYLCFEILIPKLLAKNIRTCYKTTEHSHSFLDNR